MDIGSVIIGVLSLACFIVPIVYLQWSKKAEKEKFLKEFLALAAQHQLVLTEHDFWNHHIAIGLDTKVHKLFFLNRQFASEQACVIDLAEVEKCRVVNISTNVKVGNETNKVIERLELLFECRHSKPATKSLLFYNRDESMGLYDELQIIEKWAKLLNTRLASRQGILH